MGLYIRSPIRLHGIVLNQLSTGTNLFYLFFIIFLFNDILSSSVGIAMGYGLNGRRIGFISGRGKKFGSSSRRPDRLRGPPSFVANGYRRLFPQG
jgi:hypothetical protein